MRNAVLPVIACLGLGIGLGSLVPLRTADPVAAPIQKRAAVTETANRAPAAVPQRPASGPGGTSAAVAVPARMKMKTLTTQQKRELAKKIFKAGDLGATLTEATALFEFATMGLPESKRLDAAVRELRQRPEAALSEIREGLKKFPPELESERMFLVQFATQLEAAPEGKLEMLRNELARSFELTPEQAEIGNRAANAAITVDCLLEVTKDPKEIERSVLPALMKFAGDGLAANLLLARLATKQPDLSRDLAKQMGIAAVSTDQF